MAAPIKRKRGELIQEDDSDQEDEILQASDDEATIPPNEDEFDLKIRSHAQERNMASEFIDGALSPSLLQKPCIVGIDEAGRGPVCGPMVYGIAVCPLDAHASIKALGFADSKTLTEDKREALFETIKKNSQQIGWIARSLSPYEISAGMLGRVKYNLNAISHDTAIALIRRLLDQGVDVVEAYLDTVGDPRSYEAKLSALFPRMKIRVEAKADSTYPIVSAASICAKVTRDRVINYWKVKEQGIRISRKFGSGYPSDPNTKAWLKAHFDQIFGFPGITRFSWATAKKYIEEQGALAVWEDDGEDSDDEDDKRKSKPAPKNQRTLKDMHASATPQAPTLSSAPKREHRFFNEMRLSSFSL